MSTPVRANPSGISQTPEEGVSSHFIRSIALLIAAQIAALSLWFSAAAILPALAAERGLTVADLGVLSTAVQAGFVIGALSLALTGAADRLSPKAVFMTCALVAAAANLGLLTLAPESWGAIVSRFLVGAALAGVYPVGLKIAVGWSLKWRGLLSGLLVGALTLGTASSYFAAYLGETDWRFTLMATSAATVVTAGMVLFVGLGPFHGRAARFDPGAAREALTNAGVRSAYLGYFGHMWELYAYWAWVGVIAASAATAAAHPEPEQFGALIAVLAIGLGGLACFPAGALADRFGKATVAKTALAISGTACVAAAVTYSGPLWLFAVILVIWGVAVIPDSAQFSALVADHAPPDKAGSLLTLQTALGFALTTVTVQGTPRIAEAVGWQAAIAVLAIGPALGWVAMARGRFKAPVT